MLIRAAPERLGFGRVGEIGDVRLCGGGALGTQLGLDPGAEPGHLVDLPPLPEDEEQRAGREEHPEDHQEERGLQRAGHLPDLGGQEQEGGEQQEQREGPDHEIGHVGQLAEHLPQRPPGHGHEAVAGHHEGHGQDHQVEHDGTQRVGDVVLAEQRRQHRRSEDEQGQLGRTHPVGPLEGPPAAQAVHHHDATDQDGQATEQRQELVPPLPVLVQAEGQLGQEHHGQEGGGPGPDVGGCPVVVDEVGQAPSDEPALGPTAEVGPREVIHPGESGP